MKFLFPKEFSKKTWETFLRFPMVILSLIILITIFDYSVIYKIKSEVVNYIIITMLFAIPLFLSLTFIQESVKKLTLVKNILINTLTILTVFLFYLLITMDTKEQYVLTIFCVIISTVILVFISPFLSKKNENALWYFHLLMFYRFLISTLYTLTLYCGVFLGLAGVCYLFDVNIFSSNYVKVYFSTWFLFQIWCFLSGIPKDLSSSHNQPEYPKGLLFFIQNLLIPLLSIYLLILYIYMSKIIIDWELPKGNVGWMVTIFCSLNLFTFYLLYPKQREIKSGLIKFFWKYFNFLMIPLLIMLFIGLNKRLSDYGFTVTRFYLFLTAFWMTITVLYFIFSKTKNIKFIPFSIIFVLLITSFGPLSAPVVSLKSQIFRLENILTKNRILVHDKFQETHHELKKDDQIKIKECFEYIFNNNGDDQIKHWFKSNKTLSIDDIIKTNLPFMKDTELEKYNNKEQYTYLSDLNEYQIPISGFDYILDYNESYNHTEEYEIKLNQETSSIDLYQNEKTLLSIQILPIVEKIREKEKNYKNNEIPINIMTIIAENENLKVKVLLRKLRGKSYKNKFFVTEFYGKILIKLKT